MTILLGILLAITLAILVFRYHLPLRRLRKRLRDIASGSIPRTHFAGGAEIVRDLSLDLDHLVEMQSDTVRRAEDEGFNLRAVLSSMKEGVLIVDSWHRIRLANEGIHSLLPHGVSPINRTPLELFRNHLLHRAIEASLTFPEPHTSEMTLDVFDHGQLVPRHFEVTVVGMRPGGRKESLGALIVFHDITRVKALEGMRKEFVANVSHELRTPLSIISGYLETILDDDLNDLTAARKFLTIMRKHTQRLHLLVEDLLIISQLESQKTTLEMAPMNLAACLEKVVERLEPSLEQRDVRIQLNFPPDFPQVEADEHRMDQAFFNLLDNAVKHGCRDHGVVEVHGSVAEGDVIVSVRDYGPGIPTEDQPHIFERFYRVDRGRSRQRGGTGLGLSIVKHIVQAHGGTVEVESRIGKGSTFHVKIPI
ncbi:MAG TPA: ATP-binding protein [Chthoniobacterales bacterium]